MAEERIFCTPMKINANELIPSENQEEIYLAHLDTMFALDKAFKNRCHVIDPLPSSLTRLDETSGLTEEEKNILRNPSGEVEGNLW